MLPPIVGRLIGDDSHFRNTMRGATGAVAALGGAFAAVGAASFFKSAVMGASDLAETMSKVGIVFGKTTDQVVADAKFMADKFGIPKQTFLDASASIGLIGKSSGIAAADLGQFSTGMASLATDASSFFNVPLEEALLAIRSGLVGESEPLRKFGVLLSAAAVDAKATEMGLETLNGNFTEGAKVQARAALITEGLKDANGDLERTQGSLSNRLRELKGRFTNFTTELGSKAIPAVLGLLDAGENLKTKLGPTFKTVGEGFKALGSAFSGEGVTSDGFVGVMERIGVSTREVFDAVKEAWPQIKAVIMGVVNAVVSFVQENWPRIKEIVTEAMQTVQSVIKGVVDVVVALWGMFGSQITTVAEAIWRNVQTAFEFMVNAVDAGMNVIRGIIDLIAGIITGDWSRAWDGIKSIFSGVWDAIKNILGTALDLIKSAISQAWELVGGIFKAAWEGIVRVVREGVAWVVDKMLAMAEWVVKAAEMAFGWIPVIGDRVHGLADKIEEFRNRTNAALRGIENKVIDITVRVNEIRNLSPDIPLATAVQEARLERYALGGWVKGPVGKPQLAIVHGGEYVVTADDARGIGGASMGSGGGGVNVTIIVQGSVVTEQELAEKVRDRLIDLGRHVPSLFGSAA